MSHAGKRPQGPAPRSRSRRWVADLRRLLASPATVAHVEAQLLEARHQILLAERRVEESHRLLHDTYQQLLETRHLVLHGQHELADSIRVLCEQVDGLAPQLDAVRGDLAAHRRETAPLGRSVVALGEALARLEAPDPAGLRDAPRVSVVLPVRDRTEVVGIAIRSVVEQTYPNWELLVVDDGPKRGLSTTVAGVAGDDPRVRVLAGAGTGPAAARNVALAAATGEVIAYIDSDNRWLPTYLAHVAEAFRDHPDAGSAVAMQLVVDDRTGTWYIRDDDRLPGALREGNFIDLNAFAHRRALVAEAGPFDETLRRLSDWDLALRYVPLHPVVRIPVPGSVYRFGQHDQVSTTEPLAWHVHRVREKHRGPTAAGLRVLVAEWHYPQLSESYVQADIEGLKALGAHVEVWSEESGTAAPFVTAERVHHGGLGAAIAAVEPHVVLCHWLHVGDRLAAEVGAAGVPLVVRGHGFDFAPDWVVQLSARPAVRRVYLFPHLAAQVDGLDDLVRSLPVAFDADRFVPAADKDPRLVVRAGVAIPAKDYETFFAVAERCPDHRFVLCVVTAHGREDHVDEMLAMHAARGSTVEIRVDVPYDEVATLVATAGTYLHTHGVDGPYGMPISIAEALATGCLVLAPDRPGAREYLGGVGRVYATVDQAADLVREALTWSDAQWRTEWMTATERAFSTFTHVGVAEEMVRDWTTSGLWSRSASVPG